jgi:hypothetical protein
MRFIGSGVHPTLLLALMTIFCGPALAHGSSDRTEVGKHISIAPNQRTGEVTCFGCSVRIRGHVTSDLTVFGGSVILEDEAQVDGDLTTFGGNVRLDKDVKVGGDLVVFGGHIRRSPGALVRGDVVNMESLAWLALIVCIPLAIFAGFIALVVWLVRQLTRPVVPAIA